MDWDVPTLRPVGDILSNGDPLNYHPPRIGLGNPSESAGLFTNGFQADVPFNQSIDALTSWRQKSRNPLCKSQLPSWDPS